MINIPDRRNAGSLDGVCSLHPTREKVKKTKERKWIYEQREQECSSTNPLAVVKETKSPQMKILQPMLPTPGRGEDQVGSVVEDGLRLLVPDKGP